MEITQQFEYEPDRLKVIEHVQYKYGCAKNLEGVKMAPKPAQPLAGGLAGPGLVAHIVEDKHANHLPLYRQEQMFNRLGYEVSRSSMARWLREVAEEFGEILERMKERLLKSKVIHADETPLKFIDREKPRGKTRQGYLWTYYGDQEHPYVIFSFSPSRAAEAPIAFLGDYAGYLITDGYVAYERLVEKGKVTLVCCHAHARRPFAELLKLSKNDSLAKEAIIFYQKLYAVEDEARKNNLSPEARYELRLKKSLPILDAFKQWLDHHLTKIPEQSKIGKAIRYCIGHWTELTNYLKEGRIEIDNNLIENAIRPFALGRKVSGTSTPSFN